MKKKIVTLLTVMSVATVMSGCGEKAESTAETTPKETTTVAETTTAEETTTEEITTVVETTTEKEEVKEAEVDYNVWSNPDTQDEITITGINSSKERISLHLFLYRLNDVDLDGELVSKEATKYVYSISGDKNTKGRFIVEGDKVSLEIDSTKVEFLETQTYEFTECRSAECSEKDAVTTEKLIKKYLNKKVKTAYGSVTITQIEELRGDIDSTSATIEGEMNLKYGGKNFKNVSFNLIYPYYKTERLQGQILSENIEGNITVTNDNIDVEEVAYN